MDQVSPVLVRQVLVVQRRPVEAVFLLRNEAGEEVAVIAVRVVVVQQTVTVVLLLDQRERVWRQHLLEVVVPRELEKQKYLNHRHRASRCCTSVVVN